ncbi:hypothetical protein [Pseudozobellia sp. WGM2]|uniref:hypothetical protein n=1 Tax=Pseudozobellia sp. WGM2 TaxID=2787625 RepID=UPI001ADED168|nr:hypothetical protein [Pseudozobellia sp. WGM2]
MQAKEKILNLKSTLGTVVSFYFFLLMGLYHFKIKYYPYWSFIAFNKESSFDFSFVRFLFSLSIFAIDLYILLALNKNKFFFTVIAIFFLLLTVPSLIAFTSGEMYPVNLLGYHQALFIGLTLFSKIKIDFTKFPVLNKKQALYMFFVLISIGIMPYLVVYGPYLNLKNLILLDVYETRRAISALSNPYFGYTYSLFTKIVIPLFLIFSLELKNRIMTGFAVVYLLLFYLFGAHKTVYAGLIVIFLFYGLGYYSAIRKILKWSNVLIIIAMFLAIVGFDLLWIYSFRRVHFIPTLLDICYLDFFNDNYLYWSNSVLKSLFDYPYDVTHAHLIGEAYFNSPSMDANNGLISDGFMNWGTWGVVINILIVAFYFMILNSLRIPAKYFGIYVLIIFSFISSSTSTVMLTHGALALLLISIFVLNKSKST